MWTHKNYLYGRFICKHNLHHALDIHPRAIPSISRATSRTTRQPELLESMFFLVRGPCFILLCSSKAHIRRRFDAIQVESPKGGLKSGWVALLCFHLHICRDRVKMMDDGWGTFWLINEEMSSSASGDFLPT